MVLLWLLPTVVVTVAAMLWVSWRGRQGRGEVDRDEALSRLGAALERRPRRGLLGGRLGGRVHRRSPPPGYAVPPRARERSTGVAVRRSAVVRSTQAFTGAPVPSGATPVPESPFGSGSPFGPGSPDGSDTTVRPGSEGPHRRAS